ncbi:MAG: hypothetical protein WCV92_00210 [Candidatus Buchananbacteria bacterium]
MDSKFLQSNGFKLGLWIIGIIILVAIAFVGGMYVGFEKASFSYQWGENYHRNFAGPKDGFGREFMGRDFMEAHGIFGQIIKIDGNTIIVKGNDNTEKSILVSDKTVINRFKDKIKIGDLKTDDGIVVIGDPNGSGQIEAKLIRVMPAFPGPTPSSSMPLPPPPLR